MWLILTLVLLTCRIWWALNNASKWQMGFNWAFNWLICKNVNLYVKIFCCTALPYLLKHRRIFDIRVTHLVQVIFKTNKCTIYTGCPRRNVPDFGRVFLMLKYTDITQNSNIQSRTFMEIMAREKCDLLAVPRTAPVQLTRYVYTKMRSQQS